MQADLGMKSVPLWQDRSGRALFALAAVSAVAAFAAAVGAVRAASSDRLWVETWRMLGFLVFAGLFAVLAWRPRSSPGIWELVFLDKAALVVIGSIQGSQEALSAITFDAGLVVVMVAAWVLTRGWRSWLTPRAS